MIRASGSGIVHICEEVQTNNPSSQLMKVVVNCRADKWDHDLQQNLWHDNYVEFRSGGKTGAFVADQVRQGDRVGLNASVKGREYQGKWYMDLWIDDIEIQEQAAPQHVPPQGDASFDYGNNNATDDLPLL